MKQISQQMVSPLVMWLLILLGIAFIYITVPPYRFALVDELPISFLFVPAFLYWCYFFFGAVSVNRQAPRSVKSIRKIITWGVYAQVRHPIYSADIVLSWGIFFLDPSYRMLLAVVLLNGGLLIWMRLEETFLLRKFRIGYRNYMKRVPRVIPRVNFS